LIKYSSFDNYYKKCGSTSVHILFIDSKMVDSIHKESLISVLKKFKMFQKLINLLKMNIEHTDIKAKLGYSNSNAVQVT